MSSIDVVREFLGWCSVINVGLLAVAALALVWLRGWASKIHARMFGLSEQDISREYFRYLARYKTAVLVFNVVPYVALRLMA